jgi:LacI family transcriptional regulator
MTGHVAIKDVAAAARVSTKTVSRVLNGVSTVDPSLRRRVEKAIAALDYVPSPAARSLRTGTGSLVGVVVDAIDDPFFSELVSGVEDQAIQFGLDVVVASTRCEAQRERQQLQRLLSQRAKGVILAPAGHDDSFLQGYRSTTPVVTVDRAVTGIDSVTVDDRSSSRVAVRHLAGAGHRRIGLLGYDPLFVTSRRRREGYHDALQEVGLGTDELLVPEVPFAGDGIQLALTALLALPDPPTALFLTNARQAPAVVSTVHALGRSDIAMVSFGDFSLADAVRPAVSCVNQEPRLMGALAFLRLADLFAEPQSPPQNHVMATSFVDRAGSELDGVRR